ncbi:hypothetical protein BT69DRAFT_1263289 [Atractiella rhizophila]|nr:hypothetical protein BT69DRAFT_1263289 [Atractiella rhizophila]
MVSDLIYNGEEKLIICLDIGTTYCGASFAHLLPKQAPRNQVVQKFKGTTASKFPSVAWYDKNGTLRAVGAEAQAEHQNWNYVQLFKLHLHPQKQLLTPASFEIPPLPNVKLSAIYSDFVCYLIDSTKSYFLETTHNGHSVWETLSPSADLVIAHPNGWGIREQAFLRDAVLKAHTLSITFADSHKRVSFCTEAEASLHFVLKHTESQAWLKPGISFTVCDAGGSTVDIATYSVKEVAPRLRLEESTAPDCTLTGSIFVNKAMEELLRAKLVGSRFSSDEDIALMMAYFEQHTKPLFCGHERDQVEFISFGGQRDNDQDFGIRRGRLTVDGELLQEAFKGCIDIIIRSLQSQVHRSNGHSKCILLVGGFGESVYLRRKIRESFERTGIQVIAVDEPAKKAVAEGLSLFSSKYLVSHRTSSSNFGITIYQPYDETKLSHRTREHLSYSHPYKGVQVINGYWSLIASKNRLFAIDEVVKNRYQQCVGRDSNRLDGFSSTLYCCDAPSSPEWAHDLNGHISGEFRPVATIHADLSALRSYLTLKQGTEQKWYYEVNFEIGIKFGSSELEAFLIWQENGVEKRGPATILPIT